MLFFLVYLIVETLYNRFMSSSIGQYSSSVGNACSICFEPMEREATALSCGHQFHAACINIWEQIKHNCPLCRESDVPINETHLVTVLSNAEVREGATTTNETNNYSDPTRVVKIIGNYLYIKESDQVLRIVKISDLSNPNTISALEGLSANSRLPTRIFGSVTVRIQ